MFPTDNEQALWIGRGERLALFLYKCMQRLSQIGRAIRGPLAARSETATAAAAPTEPAAASTWASAERRPSRLGRGTPADATGVMPRTYTVTKRSSRDERTSSGGGDRAGGKSARKRAHREPRQVKRP